MRCSSPHSTRQHLRGKKYTFDLQSVHMKLQYSVIYWLLGSKLRGQLSSKGEVLHKLRSYGDSFLGELTPDSSGQKFSYSTTSHNTPHSWTSRVPSTHCVRTVLTLVEKRFIKELFPWRIDSRLLRKNLPINQQHCMTVLPLRQLKCAPTHWIWNA